MRKLASVSSQHRFLGARTWRLQVSSSLLRLDPRTQSPQQLLSSMRIRHAFEAMRDMGGDPEMVASVVTSPWFSWC